MRFCIEIRLEPYLHVRLDPNRFFWSKAGLGEVLSRPPGSFAVRPGFSVFTGRAAFFLNE
jgi:hypothetical protein